MAKNKKLSVPRELPEIEKEYQQTCFVLGQTQYQIGVYQQQLNHLQERLLTINKEAGARKQLNDDKAKSASPETGAKANG